jgi:threonine dehydrogenase-like Zn-dependent dehydrogenase
MSVLVSPSRKTRKRGDFMRTAVLREPRHFEIIEAAVPEPADNEVCVRVEGCGICGSNLPVWEGREWFSYPFEAGAPGHEAWGTVESLGSGARDIRVGQRVAMLSYHGFAEYDLAQASAVVPLPDDVPQFPGEPLGCAMNIWRRCAIEPGQTVAIVGIGFIGAALTQLAAHAGARVIAVSRRPFALQTATQCGAWKTLEWQKDQAVLGEIDKLTGGALCPRVIECVGTQQALDLATSLTGVRGTLIIAGYHQDGLRQVNMQQWNWRGLDVINAHERDPAIYRHGMETAVDAVSKGVISLKPLLTHRFDLADIEFGFQTLAERPDGFLKAWIGV